MSNFVKVFKLFVLTHIHDLSIIKKIVLIISVHWKRLEIHIMNHELPTFNRKKIGLDIYLSRPDLFRIRRIIFDPNLSKGVHSYHPRWSVRLSIRLKRSQTLLIGFYDFLHDMIGVQH